MTEGLTDGDVLATKNILIVSLLWYFLHWSSTYLIQILPEAGLFYDCASHKVLAMERLFGRAIDVIPAARMTVRPACSMRLNLRKHAIWNYFDNAVASNTGIDVFSPQ